jgi:uncharacterized membrane protein
MADSNGQKERVRQWAHRLFEIGIWWKGIDGVLEVLGGFFVYFESTQNLSQWLVFLTQYEWSDPQGVIPAFLLRLAASLSHHGQTVAAVYLWGHGAIKVGLVLGLLTGRRALYPWAMLFLAIFCFYQFSQFWKTGSAGYLIVTLLDLAVIPLVYLEYRRLGTKAEVRP